MIYPRLGQIWQDKRPPFEAVRISYFQVDLVRLVYANNDFKFLTVEDLNEQYMLGEIQNDPLTDGMEIEDKRNDL